jgi:hypothetical protein
MRARLASTPDQSKAGTPASVSKSAARIAKPVMVSSVAMRDSIDGRC